MDTRAQDFNVTVQVDSGGRSYIELPFDPAEAWGAKERHHVNGSINGEPVRGPVERYGERWRLALGPAWLRDRDIAPGDAVRVILAPEGPQRDSLAPDVAAALEAEPDAGAFFDSLATFYRKGYLRWLDGASRRPEVRAARLQEFVQLLKAEKKSRD